MKESRDPDQRRGHAMRGRVFRSFPSSPITKENLYHFQEKGPTRKGQHQGSRTFKMSIVSLERRSCLVDLKKGSGLSQRDGFYK